MGDDVYVKLPREHVEHVAEILRLNGWPETAKALANPQQHREDGLRDAAQAMIAALEGLCVEGNFVKHKQFKAITDAKCKLAAALKPSGEGDVQHVRLAGDSNCPQCGGIGYRSNTLGLGGNPKIPCACTAPEPSGSGEGGLAKALRAISEYAIQMDRGEIPDDGHDLWNLATAAQRAANPHPAPHPEQDRAELWKDIDRVVAWIETDEDFVKLSVRESARRLREASKHADRHTEESVQQDRADDSATLLRQDGEWYEVVRDGYTKKGDLVRNADGTIQIAASCRGYSNPILRRLAANPDRAVELLTELTDSWEAHLRDTEPEALNRHDDAHIAARSFLSEQEGGQAE